MDASDIVVTIEIFLAAMTWPPAVRIILAADFIRTIRAIIVAVASPMRRYAVIPRAGEFYSRATGDWLAILLVAAIPAIVVVIALPLLLDAVLVRAREFVGSTGLVAAIFLVLAVSAVELMIAQPAFRYALPRAALELRLAARFRPANRWVLVGAIGTVPVAVAVPVPRDAPAVRALELRVAALVYTFAFLGGFIGIV